MLYLLPTKVPGATDFSQNRFDPLLEESEYLREMFSNVKNVGTKRAGSAVLYIRGSNSRKGLKEIPVAGIAFDEYDEMRRENIPLAWARLDGQRDTQAWVISTPTLPGLGINEMFQGSSQDHFLVTCPACGRLIYFTEDNLIVTGEDQFDPDLKNSHIICLHCKAHLTDPKDTQEQFEERKAALVGTGVWTSMAGGEFEDRGFYINQLYSCAKAGQPAVLAKAKFRGLTNKAYEQEWYNSKLGTAHEVEGARVSLEIIKECMSKEGRMKSDVAIPGRIHTMGVDVGKWLHIEIAAWVVGQTGNDINARSKPIIVWEGKLPMDAGMTHLDSLMKRYQIYQCVVDANPERQAATAFARRFWGHVKLCFFARGMSSKSLGIDSSEGDFKINVDRTMWLDSSMGRYHNISIDLPIDLSSEYKTQIQNIARIYEEDGDGNPVGRWVSNNDDHFAFARVYNEIALPLAVAITQNKDVKVFL